MENPPFVSFCFWPQETFVVIFVYRDPLKSTELIQAAFAWFSAPLLNLRFGGQWNEGPLLVFLFVLVSGGKAKEQRFNLAISTLNRCFVWLNCNPMSFVFWKNLMWMQQLCWQSWGVADQVQKSSFHGKLSDCFSSLYRRACVGETKEAWRDEESTREGEDVEQF